MGNLLFQIASCLSLVWDNNSILYVPDINTWCNVDNENIDKSKQFGGMLELILMIIKKFLKLFVSDMDIILMFLNFIIKFYKGYLQSICIFINQKKNYRFFWTNQNGSRLYLFKIFKIFKFKYLLITCSKR